MNESERLLAAGIRAARVNQHDKARDLLMRVLELDEENEEAWLWLSNSVDDIEDKRVCLENVLTLNPENAIAPLRLRELDDRSAAFAAGERAQMTNQPLGGALKTPYHPYAQPTVSRYEDVWSQDKPLCAFCATPVHQNQWRCGNCWRKLAVKVPTYARPSQYFEWLMIYLALADLLLIGFFVLVGRFGVLPNLRFLLGGQQQQLVVLGALIVPLLVLTFGAYFRKPWAYWLLMVHLGLQLLAILGFAATSFGIFVGTFFYMAPAYVLHGLLFYILYRAWPDFEQRSFRRLAFVPAGLISPYELDKQANLLAQKGQWANAIMHWRRANSYSGGNGFYQWRLGRAYARLGFYRRAVDELSEAVQRLVGEDKAQAQAQRDLKRFKRKLK